MAETKTLRPNFATPHSFFVVNKMVNCYLGVILFKSMANIDVGIISGRKLLFLDGVTMVKLLVLENRDF